MILICEWLIFALSFVHQNVEIMFIFAKAVSFTKLAKMKSCKIKACVVMRYLSDQFIKFNNHLSVTMRHTTDTLTIMSSSLFVCNNVLLAIYLSHR